MQERDIDRRTFVRRTGAATGTLALAGCLGGDGDNADENGDDDADENGDERQVDDGRPAFPEIEDKPDAVYTPTHRESMRTLEPITAGDYRLAPMLSYPHPFWNVASDELERVSPEQMEGVHMMFTLWDAETDTVLPVDSGNVVSVSRDGERIARQSMWPMISQEMGFHFGDNVSLDGDGTYAVEVELPPLSIRTTGDLEGRFTETETATFEFDYDQAFRDAVYDVEYFDEERWGERGALEPMGHGGGDGGHGDDADEREDGSHDGRVPYSRLPEVDEFPGTLLLGGESGDARPETTADLPRSGDAAVLTTLLEPDHRLADGDEPFLLVSLRTPYNRVPLPGATPDATVERDGEAVTDDPVELEGAIDGEYGIHYGSALGAVRAGDTVTLTVRTPPQVARHQGYETAFLEMGQIELTVPDAYDE